jgi:chloride channel protein, CIC family
LAHPAELFAYALLGVVGGVISLAFMKIIAYFRPRPRDLPECTRYVQPAIAGLAIGSIGLRLPQTMGAGYLYVDQALHNQYTWEMLAILGFAKILTTSLSFVSRAGDRVVEGVVSLPDILNAYQRARQIQ